MGLMERPAKPIGARHFHPGRELGFVLEGAVTAAAEGEPEVAFKVGASLYQPPGEWHVVGTSAVLGEGQRDGSADAATAAGDERDMPCQSHAAFPHFERNRPEVTAGDRVAELLVARAHDSGKTRDDVGGRLLVGGDPALQRVRLMDRGRIATSRRWPSSLGLRSVSQEPRTLSASRLPSDYAEPPG